MILKTFAEPIVDVCGKGSVKGEVIFGESPKADLKTADRNPQTQKFGRFNFDETVFVSRPFVVNIMIPNLSIGRVLGTTTCVPLSTGVNLPAPCSDRRNNFFDTPLVPQTEDTHLYETLPSTGCHSHTRAQLF